MNLHKVIVRPGIRTSESFARLTMLQRDLFYGLLSAANTKGGWFEANAALLRAALYAPCLGKVSEREVKDGLLKLREVGLLKLWTGRNGRAYGAVLKYGQRFAYGETLPAEAEPPGDELPLDEWADEDAPDDPEPEPPRRPVTESKPKRIEESVRGPRSAPATHTPTELREDALARLARAFPSVNVLREFEKAAKKQGGEVDLLWFERHWLPNCGTVVSWAKRAPGGGAIEPEPEAWGVWLEETYPGNVYGKGGTHEGTPWDQLPKEVRAKIAREMGAMNHAN